MNHCINLMFYQTYLIYWAQKERGFGTQAKSSLVFSWILRPLWAAQLQIRRLSGAWAAPKRYGTDIGSWDPLCSVLLRKNKYNHTCLSYAKKLMRNKWNICLWIHWIFGIWQWIHLVYPTCSVLYSTWQDPWAPECQK